MTKHNCSACRLRAWYDSAPKSLLGRLWRWHISFCPGWKAYMGSLSDEERSAIEEQYNIKKKVTR